MNYKTNRPGCKPVSVWAKRLEAVLSHDIRFRPVSFRGTHRRDSHVRRRPLKHVNQAWIDFPPPMLCTSLYKSLFHQIWSHISRNKHTKYSLAIVSQCYKCIEISQLLYNDISYFNVKNCLQILLLQLLYLSRKLAFLVTSNTFGSLKLKYIRQSSIIDILFVLKSFIKKRSTAKSKELTSDFFRQQASVPYIKIGRHLLSTSCKVTSSEASLSSLPNIAFKERYYRRA